VGCRCGPLFGKKRAKIARDFLEFLTTNEHQWTPTIGMRFQRATELGFVFSLFFILMIEAGRLEE
jgi:hypothetical protein